MFKRIILMLSIVFLFNVMASESTFIVEKERIAEQMKKKIEFKDELSSLSSEEKDAYIQMLNIEKKVADKIPSIIYAKDSDSSEKIFNSRSIVLKYNDVELNNLTLQKAVMDIYLDLEQTRLLPSLNKTESKEIEEDIISIIDKAELVIKQKMNDLIPEEIIEKQLEQLSTELIKKINDVTTYTMKKKPDKQEINNFLSSFEEMLESSKQRAVKRLERLPVNSENNYNNDTELREKEIITNEVILTLRRYLLKTTSPSDILKINNNPDQLLAGYTDVVRRFTERYDYIVNDRFKKDLAERSEERKNRIYSRLLEAQTQYQVNSTLKNSLYEDKIIDANINTEANYDIGSEINISEIQTKPNNFNATKDDENNMRKKAKSHDISLLITVSSILGMLIVPVIFIVVYKKY